MNHFQRAIFSVSVLWILIGGIGPGRVYAAKTTPLATSTSRLLTLDPTPTPSLPNVVTRGTIDAVEPLKRDLEGQKLGKLGPSNLIKHAIRNSVKAGVPPNTIVLLLLLPGVASLIAAARHLIGLRGFGIFLPASLSIVFLAVGPIVGIGIFIIITAVSTIVRLLLRRFKIKLQYLPRMALLFYFMALSVIAILFAAPLINGQLLSNISIFPVLFLILFVEDFIRVQLGKSLRTAFNLTVETMILSLISYILLTLRVVQRFVLLNPEVWLVGVFLTDVLVGRYSGLRLMEIYRFRKLLKSK